MSNAGDSEFHTEIAVMREYSLSEPAINDVHLILELSERDFGSSARERYEALLIAAFEFVSAYPLAIGTHELRGLGDRLRYLHLRTVRDSVQPPSMRVKSPSHFIVYRLHRNSVDIVRILHQAMDPNLHDLLELSDD
ncbi:MAG: type II toxin-antitoxin system RelE/ParE family toxin [Promicromonosporaceae bacterium]|nr:type II toxin-antitoxin system RelE/ParE family toxin [Promicromonosporaceae bacterium]